MKSSPPVSPLAPEAFPDLPAVAGVRFATGACGVKYKDRTDVLLAELAPGTTVAGTLTKSKTAAAPVLWCRSRRDLYAPGLKSLGLDAGNLVVVEADKDRELLWAMEEG